MVRAVAKMGVGLFLLLGMFVGGLYCAWPWVVPELVMRHLIGAGFDHVVIEVARPGLTRLDLPLIALQASLGSERVVATIEDAHVQYTWASLRKGFIDRIEVPRAAIDLTAMPRSPAAAGESPPTASGTASLDRWLQPLPGLPFRQATVGTVTVRREGRDGGVHEGTFGGTLRLDDGRARASILAQAEGARTYRIDLDGTDLGDVAASLESLAPTPRPVFVLRSHIQPTASSVALNGTLQADLHEMAPLLALAMPLDGDLRQVDGRLWLEWSGTAPSSVPVDALWRDAATRLTGTVRAEVRLPAWSDLAASIEAAADVTLIGNGEQAAWTVARGTHARALVPPSALALPAWLSASGGEAQLLTLDVPDPVEGTVDLRTTPLAVAMRGPIRLRYGTPSSPLEAEFSASTARWQGGTNLFGDGVARLRGRATPEAKALLHAGDARWDLTATASLDPERIRLVLQPESTLSIADVRFDQVTVPAVSMVVRRALQVIGTREGREGTLGPGEVVWRIPRIVAGGTMIGLDRAVLALTSLDVRPAGWSGKGVLNLEGMVPTAGGRAWPPSDWTLQAQADPSKAVIQVKGATRDRLVTISGIATHRTDRGEGAGHLVLEPITFDATTKKLSALVTPWPHPFDVTGGTVAAEVDAAWGRSGQQAAGRTAIRSGRMQVTLNGMAGQVREYPFSGLSTSAAVEASGLDRITMPAPAQISMAALRAGIDLRNLSARVQAGWGTGFALDWIEVRNVSIDLFGGQATSEGLRYEPARASHAVSVELRRLKVQDILNLEQQQGLEGTGELEGRLPVTFGESGVTVENGFLEARPPGGVIRYRPSAESAEALVASDSQVNLVLQPLSNFHYNVLRANVQYQADGTLRLETKLAGRNPDWQKGRPVDFNLTVQENIPALIRSLGVAQGLQETIERQFERRGGG